MNSEKTKNNSQKLLEILQEKYDNKFIETGLDIDGERRRKIKYGKRQISFDEFLNLSNMIENETDSGDEILLFNYLVKMVANGNPNTDSYRKAFLDNK